MGEGIRIGGGGKSNGLYVWAKYNYKQAVNYTIAFESMGVETQCKVVTTGITTEDVTLDMLVGKTICSYTNYVVSVKDTTTIQMKVGASVYWTKPFTYEPSTGIMSVPSGVSYFTNSATQYYSSSGTIPEIMEFIDYVVNDRLNAYPNGGYHKDGYYYALVPLDPAKFGCSKIAVDKFTLSSLTNIYNGYVVNHSLGIVPKIIFLCTNEPITYGYRCLRRYVQFPTSNYLAYAVVTNNNAGGDYAGGGTGGTAPTASQVTIYERLTSNEYLQAGIEYILITMG